MKNFSVEGLLAHRSFKAGMASSVVQRNVDQPKSSSGLQGIATDVGVKVTLSPAATKISLPARQLASTSFWKATTNRSRHGARMPISSRKCPRT
ncbi:MAG: hypothetical protein ACN6PH_03345 [Pseudomonas sp.]